MRVVLLLGAALCTLPASAEPSAPAKKAARPEAAPTRRVLLVLAHPDDETMIGAALARLKERRITVGAVYATRGEGGKLVVLRRGKPVETEVDDAKLARIRTAEMRRAARHYGIAPLLLLDQPDRPYEDPETGKPTRDPAPFCQGKAWNVTELQRAIGDFARRLRPQLVITMRPDIGAIHAHHQAIGRITRALFSAGQLGPDARHLYAVNEIGWYPEKTFARPRPVLRIAAAGRPSRRLERSYRAFAARGRKHHRSQMVAHAAPSTEDAELVWIASTSPGQQRPAVGDDPLMHLLRTPVSR